MSAALRIWAMALRYLYLLRSSWIRVIELAYWPIMQMIMWGFQQAAQWPQDRSWGVVAPRIKFRPSSVRTHRVAREGQRERRREEVLAQIPPAGARKFVRLKVTLR